MRKKIKDIEIQEPPIEEFTKQRSCLKRSCMSGCGCLFVFILIFLLLLKLATASSTAKMKVLPQNMPESIPIYDADNLTQVVFTSGKNRGRLVEIAAFVPKLVLSPILLALDEYEVVPISEQRITGAQGFTWENFIKLMNEPMVDKNDQIEIEWNNLTAEPGFIADYYKSKFKAADYTVKDLVIKTNQTEFMFSDEQIEGMVTITDDPKIDGTDYVKLKVILPLNN